MGEGTARLPFPICKHGKLSLLNRKEVHLQDALDRVMLQPHVYHAGHVRDLARAGVGAREDIKGRFAAKCGGFGRV